MRDTTSVRCRSEKSCPDSDPDRCSVERGQFKRFVDSYRPVCRLVVRMFRTSAPEKWDGAGALPFVARRVVPPVVASAVVARIGGEFALQQRGSRTGLLPSPHRGRG